MALEWNNTHIQGQIFKFRGVHFSMLGFTGIILGNLKVFKVNTTNNLAPGRGSPRL